MPQTFKDDEGNEVQAFTEEEINKKVEEAQEAAKQEAQKQVEEVQTQLESEKSEREKLQEQVTKAEEAGGTEGGDDKQSENFRTLKEALNKKDEEINNLRKEFEDNESRRVTEYRDRLIEQYAGQDEELKKKIQHNYDEILSGVKTKTQADIEGKVKDAFRLSSDATTVNPMDAAVSGGSPAPHKSISEGSQTPEFTKNEVELGEKMGITEEDRKKYGPKLQGNPNE